MTVLTDKQVAQRIDKITKQDALGSTLIRIDTLDNVYVAGNQEQTFKNVVAAIDYLLTRKLMLESEN